MLRNPEGNKIYVKNLKKKKIFNLMQKYIQLCVNLFLHGSMGGHVNPFNHAECKSHLRVGNIH